MSVLFTPMRVYRGCHGEDDEAILEALKSNYEHGRNPHPKEIRASALFMSVSMFEDREEIASLARRRPKRVGSHVLELELQPDMGICVADTGWAGHWSIWGVPLELRDCVTDVSEA